MTTTPAHLDSLVDALADLSQAVADLEGHADASALLEPQNQADAVALLQDLRRRLGDVESTLTTTLGKAAGKMVGALSDGRQFTLERARDRTSWDHDDWKRDARRAIVQRELAPDTDLDGAVIVTPDGEVADVSLAALLHQAIAAAQEVHGSTAPKSRALASLGLYASDYCETTPAGWRLSAVKPTTPTTTAKD